MDKQIGKERERERDVEMSIQRNSLKAFLKSKGFYQKYRGMCEYKAILAKAF